MKPQAWQTDRGPALIDVVNGIGCLIGGAVVGFLFLAAVALLMAVALEAGR